MVVVMVVLVGAAVEVNPRQLGIKNLGGSKEEGAINGWVNE